MVRNVVFFMEMHQPRRLNRLLHYQSSMEPLDLLFDDELDRVILGRIAARSYSKVLDTIKEANREYGFKFVVSITGVLIEQLRRWAPQVLDKLINLIKDDAVEPVAETYYHSLAYLIDEGEFKEQVMMHVKLIEELTGRRPVTVQNTEFMYSDDVGRVFSEMGFKVALTEGVERVLGFRQPTYLYKSPSGLLLLLRHYRLSDDVGFRFTNKSWDQYPLTADKYVAWLRATWGDLVMIGLDMETFGEHMPEESGIFEFLRWMFRHAYESNIRFITASEVKEYVPSSYELNVNEVISWADVEKDTSAWIGNEMQWTSFNQVAMLHGLVKELGDEYLRNYVRLLMVSDHFYYMSTKHGAPQDVHNYFNPYYSPYRAFTLHQSAVHRVLSYLARTYGNTSITRLLARIKLPSELAAWVKGESFTKAQCPNAQYTARLITINYPKLTQTCNTTG
ncbi:glycoside hydrolase family 57 protein [Caldivirga sp.]|jgi:alpha-amylase|uniref:glycoside hydrolase family 57 protein n=1 Tax=Caldivirga sp. TaxID=2080243 RepID=UPI003D1181B9